MNIFKLLIVGLILMAGDKNFKKREIATKTLNAISKKVDISYYLIHYINHPVNLESRKRLEYIYDYYCWNFPNKYGYYPSLYYIEHAENDEIYDGLMTSEYPPYEDYTGRRDWANPERLATRIYIYKLAKFGIDRDYLNNLIEKAIKKEQEEGFNPDFGELWKLLPILPF